MPATRPAGLRPAPSRRPPQVRSSNVRCRLAAGRRIVVVILNRLISCTPLQDNDKSRRRARLPICESARGPGRGRLERSPLRSASRSGLRSRAEEVIVSERRHKQVVNIEEVAARDEQRGSFGFHARRLGTEAGSRALGCGHFEVPPGKTAFPFHFHSNFEEAIYVLAGTGTLRVGDAQVAVRAGDYVAFPPGPESAHALTNTGTTALT